MEEIETCANLWSEKGTDREPFSVLNNFSESVTQMKTRLHSCLLTGRIHSQMLTAFAQ